VSEFYEDESSQGAGSPVTAKLKWFNATKGFGFVSPVDGAPDAFLHVSVLHGAGLQQINEQAELLCEIGRGAKGPQVMRIIEVLSEGVPAGAIRSQSTDGTGDQPYAPRRSGNDGYAAAPRSSGPEEEATGVIKWYKADKGFGFITADNSDKDIFLHKSVLQKAGLYTVETGQRVQLRCHEAEKGREATWVSLL
jgi:CspA family cold shock protein